jgi:hypothetical protein
LYTTVADVIRDIVITLHKECFTGRISATKVAFRSLEKGNEEAADRAMPDFSTALQTETVIEKQSVLAEATKCTHEQTFMLVAKTLTLS